MSTNDHETALTRNKTELGFWLYLMTDIMIFASLFATFYILRPGTNGGVSGKDILDPSYALVESIVLLLSSVSCGLMLISARFKKELHVLVFLGATIILGIAFLGLEFREFSTLAAEGNDWTKSAFLSSFFTLVGTHGLHILIGIIWATVLLFALIGRGLSSSVFRKIGLFALFWHFLDLVWIFIFSIVYLIGGLS